MDASLVGGVAILERAIAYTLGNLAVVTPESLGRPTPCRRWNLDDLLEHLDDSLAALAEAAEGRRVGCAPPAGSGPFPPAFFPPDLSRPPLFPPDLSPPALFPPDPSPPALPSPGADVVRRVRGRAVRLLGTWANADDSAPVCVGEMPVTAPLVAGAGAIEVTVHGWDIARACGHSRPIPDALADELLDLSVLFVRPGDRPGRFARPIPVPAGAPPSDRLLAFLGREP